MGNCSCVVATFIKPAAGILIIVSVFIFYSLCSQETLPVTFQACVMTKDCDVTEWSEWSACSKECYDPNGPKGERTRTRKVSQFPIGGGEDCPKLEEKEPCSPQGDGVPPCTVWVQNRKSNIATVQVLLVC